MPLLTCPNCAEQFSLDTPSKPGSRVVCTVCFRSFKQGRSGPVAEATADTGSSDLYESLLDDGTPSPRAADGHGGPQVPFKRTVRSLQHDRVDCSKSIKRPFESSRAGGAIIGLLVFGLMMFGAASWYFGKIKEINDGVGKVGRVHNNRQDALAAPNVEAKKKVDDGPMFEDSSRWTVPSPAPLKIGNVSVAVTSAMLDVVKLQDGSQLPRQCLVLALQVKNFSIRRLSYNGWSSATKLCYVPQRGNVERVPSSPGNPIVGTSEPTQIGSEGTLNDVLVFEVPELGKDLELDLVPNGQGDTFLFVIPGKRIKRQVTVGFVQSKISVPTVPPAPNTANPPPTFRPPQTGGFMGNMANGGALVSADVASKIRETYERRTARIQERFEAQRKSAKTAKAKRAAEKDRDDSLDFLVRDLCQTHGITEADLDRIVKKEPGK
jgi:hypothetical protein